MTHGAKRWLGITWTAIFIAVVVCSLVWLVSSGIIIKLPSLLVKDAARPNLGFKDLILFNRPQNFLDNYGKSKQIADASVIFFWGVLGIAAYALATLSASLIGPMIKLYSTKNYVFANNRNKKQFFVHEITNYALKLIIQLIFFIVIILFVRSVLPMSITRLGSQPLASDVVTIAALNVYLYILIVGYRVLFKKPLY